ncbi:MAG TPA: ubiquinone/menaquinone biosynthesis methyltransferase [Fibrobacteria bacterium]|nr:ubiquinone/menaquinone biosynthesis methyltransferase [Fibrobacteria bacterium]
MGIAIQNMFDGIARRYDFLNHFLSAGRDKAWRRKAAGCLRGGGSLKVLDLCGGTGDFWKTWHDLHSGSAGGTRGTRPGAEDQKSQAVIADFSLGMLLQARKKFRSPAAEGEAAAFPAHGPALVRMDALKPCFKEGSFDAVLCAYGMRNLDSIASGIDEIGRLLKPGGMFVTLEFFRPTTAFTRLFYNGLAPLSIPFLGWFFSSRRQAYAYLVQSIRGFKSVGEYRECFRDRGFRDVDVIPCDFGISHIVTAVKG